MASPGPGSGSDNESLFGGDDDLFGDLAFDGLTAPAITASSSSATHQTSGGLTFPTSLSMPITQEGNVELPAVGPQRTVEPSPAVPCTADRPLSRILRLPIIDQLSQQILLKRSGKLPMPRTEQGISVSNAQGSSQVPHAAAITLVSQGSQKPETSATLFGTRINMQQGPVDEKDWFKVADIEGFQYRKAATFKGVYLPRRLDDVRSLDCLLEFISMGECQRCRSFLSGWGLVANISF